MSVELITLLQHAFHHFLTYYRQGLQRKNCLWINWAHYHGACLSVLFCDSTVTTILQASSIRISWVKFYSLSESQYQYRRQHRLYQFCVVAETLCGFILLLVKFSSMHEVYIQMSLVSCYRNSNYLPHKTSRQCHCFTSISPSHRLWNRRDSNA